VRVGAAGFASLGNEPVFLQIEHFVEAVLNDLLEFHLIICCRHFLNDKIKLIRNNTVPEVVAGDVMVSDILIKNGIFLNPLFEHKKF